ncbi:MAG TPA: peptidoglycan DD-metalloendopeptidase family protein [Actinomycetota bacterium]|nr:peptidoglycan DD-metalloendopeptidase family protein [Actinomycetota bacterium]
MRPKRTTSIGLITALLAGLLSLTAPPATAADKQPSASRWSELQKKIDQTRKRINEAKKRERGIIAQINASDIRRQALEDKIENLSAQLSDAIAALAALEAAANRTQMELDLRTRDLEQTIALLEQQQDVLNNRAASKYMAGPMSLAPVLFNTTDFSAFLTADQYVESVLSADVKVVEEVREVRDEVEVERNAIGARKAELDKQVATAQAERDRIAGIRASQNRARRAVINEINYRKNLLEKVRDERQAYEEALQSYIRESDSISGILKGAQRGQKVIQGAGKGYLVWPVSGRISSDYGERVHPIYKKKSFHTGIDIAAPQGTKVIAARDGKVVFTGYKGAFGLIVLVDHGDSVATMYSHLSRAYVSAGEKVKRGEGVGAIGCTGWCTGPHLHFEVRVEGEPTNPMRWLK